MGKESRQLYEWALLEKSIRLIRSKQLTEARKIIKKSREWPKNLGIGKPYETDERIQDVLVDYINNPSPKPKIIKPKIKKYDVENFGLMLMK